MSAATSRRYSERNTCIRAWTRARARPRPRPNRKIYSICHAFTAHGKMYKTTMAIDDTVQMNPITMGNYTTWVMKK